MCSCEVFLHICNVSLVKNTQTHFASPPPFWATVGRRKVRIYRKPDWLKWLNDWLCGKTLYLTRHDVNTRLDCCHGFSLTWLRRLLLISNAEGQMLGSVIGLRISHTHRQTFHTPTVLTEKTQCIWYSRRPMWFSVRINIALNGWKTIFT